MADEHERAFVLDGRVRNAFRAQLDARQALLNSGAARIGWKVALHVAAVEAVMGNVPAFGYLTSATELEPGDIFDARRVGALRSESEIAVELGRDVGASDEPATVREAIAGLSATLVLVDVSPPVEGFEGVVADNVYHRAFILGPLRPVAPGTLLTATLRVNGERRATGETAEDFIAKLLTIAQLLESVGERLRARDRILTGSLPHVPVGPGDTVAIAIESLGELMVTIAGKA